LRRFALDVEVRVRPEFQNDFGGLIKQDTINYSVYELVLKRFSSIDPDTGDINWDILSREEWNPHGPEDVENHLSGLLKFIVNDVKRHISAQKKRRAAEKELEDCEFCPKCHVPTMLCACEAEAQIGNLFTGMNTRELWDARAALTNLGFFLDRKHRNLIFYQRLWTKRTVLKRFLGLFLLSLISGIYFSPLLARFVLCAWLAFGYYQKCSFVNEVDKELARRKDRLSSLCLSTREHLRENATKYFAIGGSLILLYKLYQLRRRSYTQDTSSILEVGSEVFENKVDCPAPGKFAYAQDERDYKEGYSRIPPKVSHKSATTTSANLHAQVARSLRQVFIYSKGKTLGSVNGIMVASNIIMVPSHAVPRTFPFDIETTTSPGVPSAKTKDQKLTEEFCVIDRERDVAFIHLASAPASTSFVDYFPEEQPKFRSRSTRLLWKSPRNEVKTSVQPLYEMSKDLTYYGTIEKEGMLWGTTNVTTSYTLGKDAGFQADLEFNSFAGLCGGLYVDQDKAIIYGMHIAGYPGSSKGFVSVVLRKTIREAISKLDKTSPTMVVHSAGDVRVDAYQQSYTITNAKPLYLREDGTKEKTTVSFIGRVLKDGLEMTSNARTPYVKTPFVGVVGEFGPSLHRPPTSPNDTAKSMKTLNKLTDPVQHYEGQLLTKAIQDYKEQTLKCIRENKDECKDFFRIYSQAEALDGIGEFGLGGMPNDTSAGFPINKSKKSCLKRDPMDESLVMVPREFSEEYDVQAEVDYTFDCWSKGLRSEPIYKASSKVNELLPNKKAVEKVRKFYGSPIANFVASRRVLAGIPRFMRRFWRDTECLVGVNATSKEWEDLYNYVTSKSKIG
jgi:hypothetical protein